MAVTRLDITAREPLLGGKSFGATGAYEVLRGTVTFAVDPAHPRHHDIADLDKAPRTTAGKVEWWASGSCCSRRTQHAGIAAVLRGGEPGAYPGVSNV